MQNPQGKVVSVDADAPNEGVTIEVDSIVTCERCAAGKGCGAGLLGSRPGNRRVRAVVTPGLDVRVGDSVDVVLEPSNLLKAAAIVYGYPLLGAVSAVVGAILLDLGDVGAAVAALSGLVLGVFVARARLSSKPCMREFTPRVISRQAASR